MMREEEFAAHAAARWPGLVRSLVLMGLPPTHAARVASDALARLRSADRDLGGWLDLDVPTYRALVTAFETDRVPWWQERPEKIEGLEGIDGLDGLSVPARWRCVLEAAAHLSVEQIDEVVPLAAPASSPDVPGLADLARNVAVGAVPLDAVRGLVGRRRRRRTVVSVAAVGAVVIVLAAGALMVGRQVQGRPSAAASPAPTSTVTGSLRSGSALTPLRGTVPIAWYSREHVHLGTADVEQAAVTALTDVGLRRTLVRDARGGVSVVDRQGRAVRVGRTYPAGRVLADRKRGLAAWIHPGRHGDSVVVLDPARERVVLRRRAHGWARLIGIDRRAVYWADGDGQHATTFGGVTRVLRGRHVVDVQGPVRVRQIDASHILVEVLEGTRVARVVGATGVGGEISDDGRYVLSHEAAGDDGAAMPFVLDDYSSLSIAVPLPDSGAVYAAALGPADTVTYVLRRPSFDDGVQRAEPGSAPRLRGTDFELVTCFLKDASCARDARLDGLQEAPLLGH